MARPALFAAARFSGLFAFCGLLVGACTTTPPPVAEQGVHRCESFFIYEVCIADRDRDQRVDYMYFGDDLQIFMFDVAQREVLEQLQPFHECAVPMSAEIRDTSTRLLYGEDLPLTRRLALKGNLIRDYRAAQPAIDACNAAHGEADTPVKYDDPFLVDDGWDEDWSEEGQEDEGQ